MRLPAVRGRGSTEARTSAPPYLRSSVAPDRAKTGPRPRRSSGSTSRPAGSGGWATRRDGWLRWSRWTSRRGGRIGPGGVRC